jgi:hypothetical protein
MTNIYSDKNYDPGGLNNPGKGQSPANPLAPVFMKSLGIVDDLSVYSNVFAGGTINSDVGFTLGLDNFFGGEGFQVGVPGVFKEDVVIEKDLYVGHAIIMKGLAFKPKRIKTISGVHLVLAAY